MKRLNVLILIIVFLFKNSNAIQLPITAKDTTSKAYRAKQFFKNHIGFGIGISRTHVDNYVGWKKIDFIYKADFIHPKLNDQYDGSVKTRANDLSLGFEHNYIDNWQYFHLVNNIPFSFFFKIKLNSNSKVTHQIKIQSINKNRINYFTVQGEDHVPGLYFTLHNFTIEYSPYFKFSKKSRKLNFGIVPTIMFNYTYFNEKYKMIWNYSYPINNISIVNRNYCLNSYCAVIASKIFIYKYIFNNKQNIEFGFQSMWLALANYKFSANYKLNSTYEVAEPFNLSQNKWAIKTIKDLFIVNVFYLDYYLKSK